MAEKPVPGFLNLNGIWERAAFPDAVRTLLEVAGEMGLDETESWELDSREGSGGRDSLEAALAKPSKAQRRSAIMEWSDGSMLSAIAQPAGLKVSFGLAVEHNPNFVVDRTAQTVKAARRLLAGGAAWNRFRVTRSGGSDWLCSPDPPLVPTPALLVAVTEDEATRDYESAGDLLRAGWTLRERIGPYHLLGRGMEEGDDVGFLRVALPMQWHLARHARPGRTQYMDPKITTAEEAVYHQGEEAVLPTGYLEEERTALFSCALDADAHIPGWQIFDLRALVRKKELPDGRKVDRVQVVFMEREMAVRERRPLLDVGVEVWYTDDHGERVRLEE